MKAFLFIVVMFITSFAAAPISGDAKAEILQYVNTNDGNGNYEFSYETSNGIRRSESGTLVNKGKSDERIKVQGSYSYTDPDGKFVNFRYTADENGYRIEPNTFPTLDVLSGPLSSAVVATLLG